MPSVHHGMHTLGQLEFSKIQVNTAKYVILSSKKLDECEIRQNDAQKQFQVMDCLETLVNDARTPPDAEKMYRTVQDDARMTHLTH